MSEHDHGCGGISCREIAEFLLAFLERDLESAQHEEFERHLNMCPPCGHYLDTYQETIKLIHRCGREELEPAQRPAPPPESLIQAILAAKCKAEKAETDETDGG